METVEDTRTQLQKDVDLARDPKDSAEAHLAFKQDEDITADEADFHKASYSGLTHTQDNVWDPQFLEFSKWLRKTYFKDVGIEDMQRMNREGFYKMCCSLTVQFSLYWILWYTVPQYFYLWAAPLFILNCWLVQFGELVHTRSHWPKKMTGSDQMDSLVDTVAIIITGTSKEGFRRRHIAAHYSDVGNLSRIFSDVWIPFSQFPSTFYIYPHKLLMLFLDVEYCRRENLSRQQLMTEMIGFYTYLTLMIYEVLFSQTCFLLCFHMAPGVVYHGAQVMGAMIAHSGIDKRNSFNSNGLFDWREAKGLFQVTLFVVDLFANGGCSNHGIHHAHTQLPLHLLNKNLREINAYALKNFKDVRFNSVLAHNVYGDLHATLPAPKWYDYIIQATFIFCLLAYSAIIIMGAPLPPPIAFENLLVDYRFYFYVNRADVWARWKVYAEHLQITARKQLIVSPNAYLDLVATFFPKCEAILKSTPVTIPPPADLVSKICPQEVYDFNIGRPMEELRKKRQ
jgi:hypothetical protein